MSIDSAVFQYVGKAVLSGKTPYLDTFDHKGPLIYLIDALGLWFSEIYGIWLIEVTLLTLTFFLFYKIARLSGRDWKGACVAVFFAVCALRYYFRSNLTEEYALLFLSASLYIFLDYFKNQVVNRRRLIICGFSFAAVFLLKINMTALWVVMCLGVLSREIKNKRVSKIFYFLFYFLLGAAVLTLPILIWLSYRHAMSAFIADYFEFNFLYSARHTSPDIMTRFKAFRFFIKKPDCIIAAAILIYKTCAERKFADILALTAGLATFISMSVSGATYRNYGMIIIPLVLYAFSLPPTEKIREIFPEKRRRYAAVTAALYASAMIFYNAGFFAAAHNLRYYLRGDDTDTPPEVSLIREYTSESDKITVCGNNDGLYLWSGRDSVSKYSYMLLVGRVDKRKEDEYFKDVETKKPAMILLYKDYDAYDRMREITDRDYILLEISSNGYEIYLRK